MQTVFYANTCHSTQKSPVQYSGTSRFLCWASTCALKSMGKCESCVPKGHAGIQVFFEPCVHYMHLTICYSLEI